MKIRPQTFRLAMGFFTVLYSAAVPVFHGESEIETVLALLATCMEALGG